LLRRPKVGKVIRPCLQQSSDTLFFNICRRRPAAEHSRSRTSQRVWLLASACWKALRVLPSMLPLVVTR
jgi:hypothetical protein